MSKVRKAKPVDRSASFLILGPRCPITGKESHQTKASAKTRLRGMMAHKEKREKIRAFKCECGYYHLGHSGSKTRQEHREK